MLRQTRSVLSRCDALRHTLGGCSPLISLPLPHIYFPSPAIFLAPPSVPSHPHPVPSPGGHGSRRPSAASWPKAQPSRACQPLSPSSCLCYSSCFSVKVGGESECASAWWIEWLCWQGERRACLVPRCLFLPLVSHGQDRSMGRVPHTTSRVVHRNNFL